ncbi:MAG: HAMP domain-containing sensor histidine kinase [Desulfobacteraceae bacterium]|nr:HAMP domain-containing sensor histidine kinase [Desulfobacteraceae bacterium]
MKDIIELLKTTFSTDVLVLLVIFVYLVTFLKRFYQKFVDLMEKQKEASRQQADYIKERLDVVEQYLGINDKAIDLRKKQIQELSEIAKEREERRKESEQQLKETQDKLTSVLDELNKVETEYKNYVSNSQLENEEKQNLISKLSTVFTSLELNQLIRHELKNNFNVLSYHIATLANEAETKGSLNSKHIIRDVESRIQDIRSNLDTWTNLEKSASYKRGPEKLGLKTLLDSSMAVIQKLIEKKAIKIKSHWPDIKDNEISIIGVRAEIEMMFVNLLMNAIQYSPTKSSVSINVSEIDDNYCIEITNTSKYQEPLDSKMIFKAGYSHSKEGGSGYGLYIAKRIVESVGGKIELSHNKSQVIARITLKSG